MAKRIVFIGLVLIFGMVALVGCSTSTGPAKLNQKVVEGIIDHQTTKEEVIEMLGRPTQMTPLPREGLEHYLYQITLKKPDMSEFPEDKYEIWTYWKLSSTMIVPVPGATTRKNEKCYIVFDPNDVCVRHYYSKTNKI